MFSTTVRLILGAACIAGTQVYLLKVRQSTIQEAARANQFDVGQFPEHLGNWTMEPVDLDQKVFQRVGALSITERVSQDDAGRRMMIQLASFPTAEAVLPHPPPLCYSGAGWSITADQWENGESGLRFHRMRALRDGEVVNAIYWYQLGTDVVATRDELRKVLQKLRIQGQGWPPFVKVLIHCPDDDSPEGKQAAEGFSAAVYEWIAAQK